MFEQRKGSWHVSKRLGCGMKKLVFASVLHRKRPNLTNHMVFNNAACWRCGVALKDVVGHPRLSATGLCRKCIGLARVKCPKCGQTCRLHGGRMHEHLKKLEKTPWMALVRSAVFGDNKGEKND